MTMPQPTGQHRRLERLAGRWEGTETMYPSEWDPEGGTATGRNDNRLALDGFAVVTDYEQERDGVVTFRGHGVMTWDPKDECYTMHWWDNMGSPAEVFRGNFDGDVLTVSHGGAMHVRLTWDFSTDGIMRSGMQMSPDGKDWATLFECDYRRV